MRSHKFDWQRQTCESDRSINLQLKPFPAMESSSSSSSTARCQLNTSTTTLSKELQQNVERLEKEADNLLHSRLHMNVEWGQMNDWKCLGRDIAQCLPAILEAANQGGEKYVWKILKIAAIFTERKAELARRTRLVGVQAELRAAVSPIIAHLSAFSAKYNDDWPKGAESVQAKPEDNSEVYGMAAQASGIVATFEMNEYGRFNVKLPGKLVDETMGRCLLWEAGRGRSAYGLTEGVHYFETIILTEKPINVGWRNRARGDLKLSILDTEKWIKQELDPIEDQHHIGFFYDAFPLGTVLGCQLDCTQRTFIFTINGRKVELEDSVAFSSNAYYVWVSCHKEDVPPLLYLNFGQVPFKFPPPPQQVDNLPANRYVLYRDVTLMPLSEVHLERYFNDKRQETVKETIKALLNSRATNDRVIEDYGRLREKGAYHAESYALRWFQAIIEMDQIDSKAETVNRWASLIGRLVLLIFAQEPFGVFSNVQDFIFPYSKLQVAPPGATLMVQNIVLLFAAIEQTIVHRYPNARWYANTFSNLSSFLVSAFLATNDPMTALAALIGLQTERNREMLKSRAFSDKRKAWKSEIEKLKKGALPMSESGPDFQQNSALTQLHLVLVHFEHWHLSYRAPFPGTPTSLSPFTSSPEVKLSRDYQSARSDWHWQCARSHLSIDGSLFDFAVFFEVTLITSGSMRIGWTTASSSWQKEGSSKSNLGDTESSIGYNGHSGCILHQDASFAVKNGGQWQAGDVIGCCLDTTQGKFTFYQNGEQIETEDEAFCASGGSPFALLREPYQAAVSLTPYQQVAINLGHTSFRFAPKTGTVWSFQQYSEQLEEQETKKRPSVESNMENFTLINSILAVGATITNRDVRNGQVNLGKEESDL